MRPGGLELHAQPLENALNAVPSYPSPSNKTNKQLKQNDIYIYIYVSTWYIYIYLAYCLFYSMYVMPDIYVCM